MAKKLKFIDLFCGCGGFSYGMELAGHECLLGVDFDEMAVESFKRNHPRAQGVHMDIHQLDKRRLKSLINIDDVDMVIGGPPCQGFSTVGKGQADDERNSLFEQFVRIVKLTSPKIVLFENVTGILAKKNELVLKRIFRSFEALGYNMDARVLSAEEYGVPSRRRRTIIMGVKNGLPLYPQVNAKKLVTVKKAFASFKATDGKIYNHDIKKAKLANPLDEKRLKKIPAGAGIRYEKDEIKYLPKSLRYDIDWKALPEGRFRQTRLQRLPWDQPAPTILTSRTMYYHPVEPRFLTVREAAACQSFPNDFVFEGSLTAQFRQIGNAVPPGLAKELGETIKSIAFNKKQKVKNKEIRQNLAKKAFSYKDAKYA